MGNTEARKKEEEERRLEEREERIGIAVEFLGGKDMEKIEDEEKRKFLLRKRMSLEEIEAAFARFGERRAGSEK